MGVTALKIHVLLWRSVIFQIQIPIDILTCSGISDLTV